MRIGGREISLQGEPFIVAEIGANHCGSFDICCEMIRAAGRAGAHAVKMQKRDIDAMFTKRALMQPYENEQSYGKTYGEHRRYLDECFDIHDWVRFKAITESLGMEFFATAFDLNSVNFLYDLGVSVFKVASCDLPNVPLLEKINETGLPAIVSTGGGTKEMVARAVKIFGPDRIALLHCTSLYPAPLDRLNLFRIMSLRAMFNDLVPIGYSHHNESLLPCIFAESLGARIIEVHFTLNRAWKGTDQAWSLEPKGLETLVSDIGKRKQMLGYGEFEAGEDEKEGFLKKMGKGVYPTRTIVRGVRITASDVALKCPADGGIPLEKYNEVVGGITLNDLTTSRPIQEGDVA